MGRGVTALIVCWKYGSWKNCYLLIFDLFYDDMNIGDANITQKELRSLPG